jgi:amylosucrase
MTTSTGTPPGRPRPEAFGRRAGLRRPDLADALGRVYTGHDIEALTDRAVELAGSYAAQRTAALQALDAEREADPGWFLRAGQLGYVCYTDRFAGTLTGVGRHLDHLDELGVTYLHLMPLLRPREGENDGGYAVADYRAVDPRIGTIDDLVTLAAALRARHIDLCVDLVVNHTAKEHEWARRAAAGDPYYRAFYRVFPDREVPDAYERTLREVFPEWAPGNFTWNDEMRAWVWTTFHSFQWDLDWSNPEVFLAMAGNLLFLANCGVGIVRLDAVPFMWKQLGTSCENLPECHQLLRALRAVVDMAAPATIFKAEAIVAPDDLVQYLGVGDPPRRECEIAYNNQLMVMLWSSLAARDGQLMANAVRRMHPQPAGTSWVTYVRCHDDIGWAVMDEDAASVGWTGPAHRAFLSDFYAGTFPGSFARGALFQVNPATNDSRISGSAASLCGIEAALVSGDEVALERAVERLLLLYSVAFAFGGIPLVYMGDELALRNDHAWEQDPAKATDNRWLHRPPMDWLAAERRHTPGTLEATVFERFVRLSGARRRLDELGADHRTIVFDGPDHALFLYRRGERFAAACNFADDERRVPRSWLGGASAQIVEASPGVTFEGDDVVLPGGSYAWLVSS